MVYELIKNNNGLSDKSSLHNLTSSNKSSSIFHTSPEEPLPNEGGSIMIISYLFSLLISLLTNLTTSSCKKRTGLSSRCDDLTFSLAQSIIPRDEST